MRKYHNKTATTRNLQNRHRNRYKNKTQKNLHRSPGNVDVFEREITVRFLETIIMIKLYHWKTYSYATHKATDELYSKLNENMDKFIEVLLGKAGNRINLLKTNSIKLMDFNSSLEDVKKFKHEIVKFKEYLVNLNSNPFMVKMLNTDLYNIRDEILADMNQFLYLLSFK
jgi:DNA-binding ferritin-like protein